METMPKIKGLRKPHTGHVDLTKNKQSKTPIAVIVGITLGQYTSHADDDLIFLNFGR